MIREQKDFKIALLLIQAAEDEFYNFPTSNSLNCVHELQFDIQKSRKAMEDQLYNLLQCKATHPHSIPPIVESLYNILLNNANHLKSNILVKVFF